MKKNKTENLRPFLSNSILERNKSLFNLPKQAVPDRNMGQFTITHIAFFRTPQGGAGFLDVAMLV